jgi:hypothetical protein
MMQAIIWSEEYTQDWAIISRMMIKMECRISPHFQAKWRRRRRRWWWWWWWYVISLDYVDIIMMIRLPWSCWNTYVYVFPNPILWHQNHLINGQESFSTRFKRTLNTRSLLSAVKKHSHTVTSKIQISKNINVWEWISNKKELIQHWFHIL